MAKPRVQLLSDGMRQLLRSEEVRADLAERAAAIAEAAGEGMAWSATTGRTRALAMVWTDTPEAVKAEATTRDLTRALGMMGGMVVYTTRSGRTRLATQAQAANWSRGG